MSQAVVSDELGVLHESAEELLKVELADREKEISKLRLLNQSLQDQLTQRPPVEQFNNLQMEYKNLDIILAGTQRENEKVMTEIELHKIYERTLERELAKFAGDSWRDILGVGPAPGSGSAIVPATVGRAGLHLHQRSNTIGSMTAHSRASLSPSPFLPASNADGQATVRRGPDSPRLRAKAPASASASPQPQAQQPPDASPEQPASPAQDPDAKRLQLEAHIAQVEQLRMLVLGMEQRMEAREQKLEKSVEKAKAEGKKYEAAAAHAATLATTHSKLQAQAQA